LLSRLRAAALLTATAVLLSGCGFDLSGPDQLNVAVVHSDIVFGAPKPKPTLPPTLVGGPTAALPPPFFSFGDFSINPSTFTLCPAAGLGAAPAKPAGFDTTGPPAEGAYRFQLSGAYVTHLLTFTFKIPLVGSWTEYVRHLASIPGTTTPTGNNYTQGYTFETVEPIPTTGGYYDMHWQVRTTPLHATASPPGVTVYDPQGGLVLTQVDTLDRKFKNPTTIFHPAAGGLQLAPSPTEPGTTWKSAAADATTPMTLAGSVVGKARVDACGQLIDGFEIQATVTSGGSQAALDYVVAPQYGMLIVSRKIDGTYLGVQWSNALIHRGQVDPSPLPAEVAS
jgi:hypothetical protein